MSAQAWHRTLSNPYVETTKHVSNSSFVGESVSIQAELGQLASEHYSKFRIRL